MKYEEAIKWVKNVFCGEPIITLAQREVIELLQRGEKYEAIVKEFKEVWGKRIYIFKDSNYISITNIVEGLEQKHFPKDNLELSRTIDRIKKVINETSFTCEEIAGRLIPKD